MAGIIESKTANLKPIDPLKPLGGTDEGGAGAGGGALVPDAAPQTGGQMVVTAPTITQAKTTAPAPDYSTLGGAMGPVTPPPAPQTGGVNVETAPTVAPGTPAPRDATTQDTSTMGGAGAGGGALVPPPQTGGQNVETASTPTEAPKSAPLTDTREEPPDPTNPANPTSPAPETDPATGTPTDTVTDGSNPLTQTPRTGSGAPPGGTTNPTTPSAPTTPSTGTWNGVRDGGTNQALAQFEAARAAGILPPEADGWLAAQQSGDLPTYEELNNPSTRNAALNKAAQYFLKQANGNVAAYSKAYGLFRDWIPNPEGDKIPPLGLNRNALAGGALYGKPTTPGTNPGGPSTGGPGTTPGGPGNPAGPGTTGAPANPGDPAWTPTTGIVDQIMHADPHTIDPSTYEATTMDNAATATGTGYNATGYNATLAPDAEGYNAEGYDAATADENLSGAIDRITSKDGILMQRSRALANMQANQRGIGNSTMAIQAGQAAMLDKAAEIGAGDVQAAQFNATQINAARSFTANAKNQAAQFLAAEKNQNGRFNAEQANQAAAFTANAQNVASQFLAAAQNQASVFNAGEANKASMFSIEQANAAKRYAAEAANAAKEFNATAFNQANQRYIDAMNAALAAQNDAENLARRDTAQINAQAREGDKNRATQLDLARMNREQQQATLDQQMAQFNMSLSQRDKEFTAGLSASQFTSFNQGLLALMTQDMEPDARQNALHNYMSVWSATGSLPFDIDMTAFPAAGSNP